MTTATKPAALTLPGIKALSKNPTLVALVRDYLQAKAFAECERQRVDAYIQPLFETFTFTIRPEMCGPKDDDAGQKITDKDRLYLASDEQTTPFYAACDKAHREHGFTGEYGFCPALIAQSNLVAAENALTAFALPLIAPDVQDTCLHGELRERALDIFSGLAIKANGAAAFSLKR